VRTQVGNWLSGIYEGWQSTRRGEVSLLIGIVVLAFGVRVAVAIVTTSWVFPSGQNFWQYGHEMGQIADSLAMGNGFSWPELYTQTHIAMGNGFSWPELYDHAQGPTAWVPPIYPFIMAAAFKGFGIFSQEAAMVLLFFQTILSCLSCILLYFLGKRLYNAQVGLFAAFLLAVYPPAIHFAALKIWATSLSTFCLLLVILMFLRQADHPHMKGGARLGILLGFTALVNPVIMGTYPFAFAWLCLKADGDRRTVTKTMAAILIALFLTISPWLVRNYIVFDQFVFIKSNLGNELFLGNNQYATGHWSYKHPAGAEILTEAEKEYLKRSDEGTRNTFLFRKAITFIVENPLRFAQLTMTRFAHYWTDMFRHINGWRRKTGLITYLTVLTLAVAGLLLNKVRKRDVHLVLLFLLTFPLPYYFTVVGIFRYRFPIEPLLMVFAGYTMYWCAYRIGTALYAYGFIVTKEKRSLIGVPIQSGESVHILPEHVVPRRMD